LSGLSADITVTKFGGQFHAIESVLKQAELTYSILRLPLFMENFMQHRATITAMNKVRTRGRC
jgi:hypothetical protein